MSTSPNPTATTALTPLCDLLSQTNPSRFLPLQILHHLQENPQSINEVDSEGFNPVHIACRHTHPLEVVRTLATANLETLNQKSSMGTIPLHTSIFRGGCVETIKFLIDTNPLALLAEKNKTPKPLTQGGPKIQCSNGWLPLHYACGYAASPRDIVMILYHIYPEGLNLKDNALRTPFHWACEYQTFEVILELLSFDKDIVKVNDDEGRLPLHYISYVRSKTAAWNPDDILELIKCVKIIYYTYPKALSTKDKWGFTPVNLAHQISNTNNFPATTTTTLHYDLIEALEKRVDVSGVTTHWEVKLGNEWTPYSNSASGMINDFVKDATPVFSMYYYGVQYKFLIETRISGKCVKVPLGDVDVDVDSINNDLSKSKHPPRIIEENWDEVEKLLNLPQPNNQIDSTYQSNNVLHLACKHSAPLNILKQIIELNADSLKQPNAEGQVPLHIIILNNPNLEAIKFIVNEYTKAAECKDKNDNFPLHLCIARESITLVQIICNFNWNAVVRRNKEGRLPYDLVLERELGEVFKGVIQPDEEVFNDSFWPVRVGYEDWGGGAGEFEVEEEGGRKIYDIYKEGQDPRFMKCKKVSCGVAEDSITWNVRDLSTLASAASVSVSTESTKEGSDPIVEFDTATRNFNHAGGVLKTSLGSQISFPTNGRPTRLKMVELDKNGGAMPELKIPNTPTNYVTNYAAPVVKFEGREGMSGEKGKGDFTVRLPTGNLSEGGVRAWSEDADGIWKEIDEKNVTTNDYYASIRMDAIPHLLTATCDSCVYLDCSVLGFVSKSLNKVVVCVVPRGMEEREMCLKVLKRKGFLLVDEGFDELRVKKGEEIRIKVNNIQKLSKVKVFMDKRLSFEFLNSALESAGVISLGLKGLLHFTVSMVNEDSEVDEVELSISHESFNIPDLNSLPISPPSISTRSNQTIILKCPPLFGPLSHLIYDFRIATLSIKDELENGFFNDVEDVEEEKWSFVGSSADSTVFSVGGVYASYCQCR
ncbi:hypothetical protein TL16_g08288 [Triparma laevis f. inornata]|uniref:Uncharacterized protein n=1 Tax=Triparma laevis f. inornata TaxID=1714386 RepID=A0A9W7EK23_9STRA|nr:hypothetical protein TL16_g08288 [Triparma laevis f. inornata]